MKHLLNQAYEAPKAEVLEVKMKNRLLQNSPYGVLGSRGDDTYGNAVEDEWD